MLQGSNLDVILQMKTYEITLLEHSHPFTGHDPMSNSKATEFL